MKPLTETSMAAKQLALGIFENEEAADKAVDSLRDVAPVALGTPDEIVRP
jgi:hypothetical protein